MGKKALLPKICHTYPTVVKLGSYTLPKVNPETIWITWHTLLFLLTSAFFYRKSVNFVMSRNTDIDRVLVHKFYFFLGFPESLMISLINVVIILMMSEKMATPGLPKITVFWNKGYERHNFCWWRYQQNFITWFKLYCRCLHLTKVW